MNLSQHFTLAEFTVSQSAARAGIDNTPSPDVLDALKRTALGLETVRALLQAPIHINSGFRCEELERELCKKDFVAWCLRRSRVTDETSWQVYFRTKSHPSGEAADIICPGFGTPAEVVRAIVSNDAIPYDQCILEFNAWCHISFSSTPRRQALIIDGAGTRIFA